MKVFYVLAFNKLFRSEIFNTIRFPEAQLCEDAWVLLDYYQISRKVVCTDEMLYCYRSRKDSISRTPTFRWIDDQLKWLEKELYFFAEAGQPKNMVYPAQNYVSLLYRNRNMYNKENCEERENGWDIAIKALLADDNLSIID